MRRCTRACIATVLALVFLVTGAGAANYDVAEVSLTLELPDEWCVYTREMQWGEKEDQLLEELGMTREDLRTDFEENGVCVTALPADVSCVMQVILAGETDEALADYSDEEVMELGEDMVRMSEGTQPRYTGYDVYSANGVKYVVLDCWSEGQGGKTYGQFYYTGVNGHLVVISLENVEGELTAQQKDLLRSVVDAAAFELPEASTSGTTARSGSSRGRSREPSVLEKAAIAGIGGAVGTAIISLSARRKNKKQEQQEKMQKPEDKDA